MKGVSGDRDSGHSPVGTDRARGDVRGMAVVAMSLIVKCPDCSVTWDMDRDPVACMCGSDNWILTEVEDDDDT